MISPSCSWWTAGCAAARRLKSLQCLNHPSDFSLPSYFCFFPFRRLFSHDLRRGASVLSYLPVVCLVLQPHLPPTQVPCSQVNRPAPSRLTKDQNVGVCFSHPCLIPEYQKRLFFNIIVFWCKGHSRTCPPYVFLSQKIMRTPSPPNGSRRRVCT